MFFIKTSLTHTHKKVNKKLPPEGGSLMKTISYSLSAFLPNFFLKVEEQRKPTIMNAMKRMR